MADTREWIQQSIDYIETNLREAIRPDTLAREAYLSKYHFHRMFRRIVGEPVMKYVQQRRLAEAARDLSQGNEKITDIALRYQFGSQESFSRAFKRVYGITPKEYRNGKIKGVFYQKAFVLQEGPIEKVYRNQPVCKAA